jgi:hypothetical protein
VRIGGGDRHGEDAKHGCDFDNVQLVPGFDPVAAIRRPADQCLKTRNAFIIEIVRGCNAQTLLKATLLYSILVHWPASVLNPCTRPCALASVQAGIPDYCTVPHPLATRALPKPRTATAGVRAVRLGLEVRVRWAGAPNFCEMSATVPKPAAEACGSAPCLIKTLATILCLPLAAAIRGVRPSCAA